ncbi:hypothetical protein PF005_g9579 [Phytophthora fragariae]|nr:hypothetical protein PF003_g21707 [Phytophthora fragariae]KAE8943938.1 hypothetical protein PF009_g6362 [Phytophthora fragariae]KAE9013790.1 hypothetical protein PF011_g8329 [Phytophthora fragariae]KAE9146542.1 hypothetical protein PF006_g8689 [Phytophthora fragariae]KAE9215053.1 hypothetical protein PF005_g9579 [Phytophthora fragariae]
MKDARRDSEVLTANTMASYVRDQYPEWLESYMVGKKDATTANESLLKLLGVGGGFGRRNADPPPAAA